jgi:hypothetical protein
LESADEFALLIQAILLAPTAERGLKRGRRASWHEESATLVIVSSGDVDGGTAFRPDDGYDHFLRLD